MSGMFVSGGQKKTKNNQETNQIKKIEAWAGDEKPTLR